MKCVRTLTLFLGLLLISLPAAASTLSFGGSGGVRNPGLDGSDFTSAPSLSVLNFATLSWGSGAISSLQIAPVTPALVPLPASAWMRPAGLGGLRALGRHHA